MCDAGYSHLCLTQRVPGELPQPQARATQRHVEVRAGNRACARALEAPLSGRPIQLVCVRAHRLRRWLRRYICCNGDCPCSGRMSEQSCPEFCLCAEVSNSWLPGARLVPARRGASTLCGGFLAPLPPQSMHRARLPPPTLPAIRKRLLFRWSAEPTVSATRDRRRSSSASRSLWHPRAG